ncbi:MAG: amidohydrolase, partial [Beijerinckiaceae bacterium]
TPPSEASFEGARTIAQAMTRIAEAAATAPGGGWIVVAGGWTEQQFEEGRKPSRAEIETAANGRHVFIQLFYRAVYLSPGGLSALGFEGGALPAGAKLEHDAQGRPTGWITGKAAAITALYGKLPRGTLAQRMDGTQRFFAQLNSYGVTGVIDPGGHNLAPGDYEALFALWRQRKLSLRVAYSICAPSRGRELEEYRHYTQFLPQGFGDSMLRFNGIGERVTWGVYNNDAPGPVEAKQFEDVARWAARRGLTMTVHWNRQSSSHFLFDTLERVARDTPFAHLRWSVAHLHDATPATLQRLKALKLGWLTQNAFYFAAPSFVAENFRRVRNSPPLRSAIGMGLPTGGGTDASRVMSYNPFKALQWMVDGRTVNGVPMRGPSERISRQEALRLWTQGSAWFAFADRERGALVPGMQADLAILSKDYLTVPAEEIGSIRSMLTMVGGRIVHASAPFTK